MRAAASPRSGSHPAVVEQRLQRHRDQLRDAVSQVDVVDADAGDAQPLVVLRDRPAGAREPAGIAAALRLRQVPDHILEHRIGGLEPERRRVADVEAEDAVPLLLHPHRLRQHRAADVVGHAGELVRLGDRHARAYSRPGDRL
jgi:hypothetical protein